MDTELLRACSDMYAPLRTYRSLVGAEAISVSSLELEMFEGIENPRPQRSRLLGNRNIGVGQLPATGKEE
jgi:hypothetical protein